MIMKGETRFFILFSKLTQHQCLIAMMLLLLIIAKSSNTADEDARLTVENQQRVQVNSDEILPEALILPITNLDQTNNTTNDSGSDYQAANVTSSPLQEEEEEEVLIESSTTTTMIEEDGRETEVDNNLDSTSSPTTRQPIITTPQSNKPVRCADNNYCLNGGKCVVSETGQMTCICPEGFYGAHCQTKNICKTIIVEPLTGDQICKKINRDCVKGDKFFRCSCDEDEYFVFKTNQQPTDQINGRYIRRTARVGLDRTNSGYDAQSQVAHTTTNENKILNNKQFSNRMSSVASSGDNSSQQQQQQQGADAEQKTESPVKANYIAECRKIDKCLGVRCRQMSEVCSDGQCICNQNSGYIRDPSDNLCKLLNPCLIQTPDGQPICGQAQCVATFDHELFRCICPVGYRAVKVGEHRSSTQCALLTDTICNVPLLNKCQHVCQVDRAANSYKCSCLRGYKSGTRAGIDDHLCFFEEHIEDIGYNDYYNNNNVGNNNNNNPVASQLETAYLNTRSPSGSILSGNNLEYIYKSYPVPKRPRSRSISPADRMSSGESVNNNKISGSNTFNYDPPSSSNQSTIQLLETTTTTILDINIIHDSDDLEYYSDEEENDIPAAKRLKSTEIIIKREVRTTTTYNRLDLSNNNGDGGGGGGGGDTISNGNIDGDSLRSGRYNESDLFEAMNVNKMSAQERCNMYCEENKICELENGSTDSYRCVCDRQGYVSIGDKCLDWCAASEFSNQVRKLLDMICWSGVCKPTGTKPNSLDYARIISPNEMTKLERESSWRPTFECDCSSSPLLIQDSETKLCKLDFEAILSPCLPGNVGYIDCIENKNAYCAVLYKPTGAFIWDLQKDRPAESQQQFGVNQQQQQQQQQNNNNQQKTMPIVDAIGIVGLNSKLKQADKLYTCVCSPEKKFLVDKPRNKARCVDECELLNVECGRFNRMCRQATIAPDDFGSQTLVRMDPDGARMNFKRTGCECLPGFNVGPSESVDFTLDDNLAMLNLNGALTNNPFGLEPPISNLINANRNDNSEDGPEHLRAKYMNINSRCLLDYDVVEFHASFKVPANFNPNWIKIRNSSQVLNHRLPSKPIATLQQQQQKLSATNGQQQQVMATNTIDSPIQSSDPRASDSATGPPGVIAASGAAQPPAAEQPVLLSSTSTSTSASTSTSTTTDSKNAANHQLNVPEFMISDMEDLHKKIVLVGQCDPTLATLSMEAYQECTKYRYWIVQKLRQHFVDWRRIMTSHLSETFDLMDGNIRLRVNKCEATLRSVISPSSGGIAKGIRNSKLVVGQGGQSVNIDSLTSSSSSSTREVNNNNKQIVVTDSDNQVSVVKQSTSGDQQPQQQQQQNNYWPTNNNNQNGINLAIDQNSIIDADIDCELTLHSASDGTSPRYARRVLLEKQLSKFIFSEQASRFGPNYYLMAPNILIRRESFDQLAEHRKLFNPCKSDYAYCDSRTKCEMVDTVNFTCTCEYGYTPIGSRDIYFADSRKEVCEDINECLFDVCKELANVSTCINEIGDYRCQCNRHYTGDNKRYCDHVCNTISCKHGKCRLVDDHHAFCECEEGYKETDCSVQDPNFALRKANMIICGSIFTSVLLLSITIAISLNSQLKKAKKKIKRLETANEASQLYELTAHQQPRNWISAQTPKNWANNVA